MKTIKKIFAIMLIAVIGLSTAACSNKSEEAKAKYGSTTLKIFLPGEYMADNLIGDFEKKFGVKVIPELFDSNEMMYTKFSAGET
ncbi:MAG: ABC transporter substrate-binding protein, partial [Lachnospiraceae bacterium]|nr:ABC transporter substrate-binding protein [Lachnospiraceae bacterium]